MTWGDPDAMTVSLVTAWLKDLPQPGSSRRRFAPLTPFLWRTVVVPNDHSKLTNEGKLGRVWLIDASGNEAINGPLRSLPEIADA